MMWRTLKQFKNLLKPRDCSRNKYKNSDESEIILEMLVNMDILAFKSERQITGHTPRKEYVTILCYENGRKSQVKIGHNYEITKNSDFFT